MYNQVAIEIRIIVLLQHAICAVVRQVISTDVTSNKVASPPITVNNIFKFHSNKSYPLLR